MGVSDDSTIRVGVGSTTAAGPPIRRRPPNELIIPGRYSSPPGRAGSIEHGN